MLDSLLIRNFRLFRELTIEGLRRVNLFVGKNNTGKTALLEAVQVYGGNARPSVLKDLVRGRHELAGPDDELRALRHLFRNHRFPEPSDLGIEIGPIEGGLGQVHLRTARHEQELGGLLHLALEEEDETKYSFEPFGLRDHAEASDSYMRKFAILTALASTSEPDPRMTTQFVPTDRLSLSTIASLWDQTSLTSLEDAVLRGLNLLEPGIQDIAFVDNIQDERIPMARVEGREKPIPLHGLGDGVARLFQLLLALVNAKDGVLLVDEFENGLHWAIQAKIWDVVFRLAEDLNVQVFATTHSRDCVAAFEQSWEEHSDKGAFFRLERREEDEIRVVAYPQQTLSDAVETGVEVR